MPEFIISPETTYIESPISPDGSIDYLTVMNQRLSERTTKENNLLYALASLVTDDNTAKMAYFERKARGENDHESGKWKWDEVHLNYCKRYYKLLGYEKLPDTKTLVQIKPDDSWDDQYQNDRDFKAELLQVYSPQEFEILVEKSAAKKS